jgi:predicted enzyme related to lactoylglutathione lyase
MVRSAYVFITLTAIEHLVVRTCHTASPCEAIERSDPGVPLAMPSRLYTVVVDSHDPARLARFWADVLDWQVVFESDHEVVIAKDENTYPGFVFVPVPEAKAGKNRLHLDLAPDDRDAEVDRIIGLGATRAEVGQTDEATWVVLADIEGNEFCVLRTREGGV